jgi:phage-related protein
MSCLAYTACWQIDSEKKTLRKVFVKKVTGSEATIITGPKKSRKTVLTDTIRNKREMKDFFRTVSEYCA